jgi:hypothetical protein
MSISLPVLKNRVVNYSYKFAILSVLGVIVTLIPMNFSNIESVFAQSGNSLGQDGDGNVASQSEDNSGGITE